MRDIESRQRRRRFLIILLFAKGRTYYDVSNQHNMTKLPGLCVISRSILHDESEEDLGTPAATLNHPLDIHLWSQHTRSEHIQNTCWKGEVSANNLMASLFCVSI